MNYSSYRITLDNYDTSSQIVLNAKQGDTGRKIYISLTDGSLPYEIEDGCRAVFTAEKPDGKLIYNDCEIENNVIIYALTAQTTAAVGFAACEIKLYDTKDVLLVSPRFGLLVEEPVFNDQNISESGHEMTALADIIKKAVSDYLEANPAVIDNTLTKEGYAAEAKVTGEKIGTLEKKSNVNTYTDPASFGCSWDSTPAEIKAAIPSSSIFLCLPEQLRNAAWNFPAGGGLVQMIKGDTLDVDGNSARVKTFIYGKLQSNGDYQAEADGDGVPTGTWYKMPRMVTAEIVLKAKGWNNKVQSVEVPGVLYDPLVCFIQAFPVEASREAYLAAGVHPAGQKTNAVNFACSTIPSADLTVKVLALM